ncbi:MAG: hypothetical protein ACREIU_12990, partial [Planctomycetota bacterium]
GLGLSVAAAGDVTGDGVTDILAGGGLFSGANGALVFQLNPGFIAGDAAGDFTGDGVPEILVGVPSMFGGAYVYSGADGSTLYSIPGANGGIALTGLCDVSGDGVADFLVGEAGVWTGLSSGQGLAFVYSGATGSILAQVIPPAGPHPAFGGAVARLRDVTGDGICDFAIADRTGDMGRGEVRVYSGPDQSLVVTLVGNTPGEGLGDVIAPAGDVDGDGVEDLIAGAPYAPPVILNLGAAGRAIVYSGADWSVLYNLGPPTFELLQFGRGVDGIGDVNGDDIPDLAIGSAGAYNQPNCKVRVFSGAPIGVASYGLGCAGSSGSVPRIGATRSPKIGTTFKVNLSETPPGLPALLLLG